MSVREEALELAREAGFWGQTWDKNYVESFIKLVRLAKQRGAEEALRNAKVSIPTNTMEQEFQKYYRKGAEEQKRKDAEICRQEFSGYVLAETELLTAHRLAKAIEEQP